MKKVFVVLVMVMIGVVFFIGCDIDPKNKMYTLIDNMDCCEIKERTIELDEYYENVKSSMELSYEVRAYYEDDEHSNEYGGIYLDHNGILNLCVVGSNRPFVSEYLIYREVNYSYDYLCKVKDEIAKVMLEYTVWMVSICEECNRVSLCLEDASKIPLLVEYLIINVSLRDNSLIIYVGENSFVLNSFTNDVARID